jgi:hypothetical protein
MTTAAKSFICGAPEEIRTPDPQIRSLKYSNVTNTHEYSGDTEYLINVLVNPCIETELQYI